MAPNTVKEIERAIEGLTSREIENCMRGWIKIILSQSSPVFNQTLLQVALTKLSIALWKMKPTDASGRFKYPCSTMLQPVFGRSTNLFRMKYVPELTNSSPS